MLEIGAPEACCASAGRTQQREGTRTGTTHRKATGVLNCAPAKRPAAISLRLIGLLYLIGGLCYCRQRSGNSQREVHSHGVNTRVALRVAYSARELLQISTAFHYSSHGQIRSTVRE